ncbi:hypothetical protein MRB53_000719 [Persea americana]|uniref:Uncharacterized protein n=1 Tax=Persea americana TaxID=3435 RepID=A0ACC2MPM9_PERAE|nr:hypothetical protein MRB53_000719 [Persea americana]
MASSLKNQYVRQTALNDALPIDQVPLPPVPPHMPPGLGEEEAVVPPVNPDEEEPPRGRRRLQLLQAEVVLMMKLRKMKLKRTMKRMKLRMMKK